MGAFPLGGCRRHRARAGPREGLGRAGWLRGKHLMEHGPVITRGLDRVRVSASPEGLRGKHCMEHERDGRAYGLETSRERDATTGQAAYHPCQRSISSILRSFCCQSMLTHSWMYFRYDALSV